MVKRWRWPCLGFVVALLGVGVGYWPVAYGDIELPTSLPPLGLLILVMVSTVLRVATDTPAWAAWAFPAAAVPAAVMARVTVEVGIDPTSHNLWPFEVVIAAVVGGFLAGVGLGLGELIRRIVRVAPVR